MIKIFTLTVLTIVLSTLFGSAQTVVLINGVPTKVTLDGTKIVSVIGPAENHLKNFTSATSEISYASADIDKINGAGVSDETTSSPTASVSTGTPDTGTVTTTTATTATTTPTESKPAALAGNYFKFERNSALLSELSINEIKDYADKITNGSASSVTLQAYYRANSKRSEQLIKNRLDACKKYFELNGVSTSAIKIEKLPEEQQSDKVSVLVQ